MDRAMRVAALLALLLAAAAPRPSVAQNGRASCNIAVIVPLTGSLENKGQGAVNGARMAMEEFSDNSTTVNLTIYDDECTPDGATAAITKAIEVDKAVGVVGAYCSGASLAASKIANEKKVPMISPTSTSPRLTTEGGPYFFRLAPSDTVQGRVVGELVASQAKKVGLIYSNEPYGEGVTHEIFMALNKAGIPVAGSIGFEDKWVPGVLKGILEGGADAVVLATNVLDAAMEAGQELRDLNFTGGFYVTDSLTDPAMLDGPSGEAFDGSIGYSLFTGSELFKKKYRAAYGTQEVPQGAATAYDAIRLFLKSCAADGKVLPGSEIQARLLKAKIPWGGSGPNVGFDANGDLKLAKYEWAKASGSKWVPWKPPAARRNRAL